MARYAAPAAGCRGRPAAASFVLRRRRRTPRPDAPSARVIRTRGHQPLIATSSYDSIAPVDDAGGHRRSGAHPPPVPTPPVPPRVTRPTTVGGRRPRASPTGTCATRGSAGSRGHDLPVDADALTSCARIRAVLLDAPAGRWSAIRPPRRSSDCRSRWRRRTPGSTGRGRADHELLPRGGDRADRGAAGPGPRLPDTWAALADGELNWPRARAIAAEIVRHGPELDPTCSAVEAVVLPQAAECRSASCGPAAGGAAQAGRRGGRPAPAAGRGGRRCAAAPIGARRHGRGRHRRAAAGRRRDGRHGDAHARQAKADGDAGRSAGSGPR